MSRCALRLLPFLCLGALSARAAARAEPLADFAFGLPKAELHLHFEGTIDPEEYLQLVARNHLPSPYASAEAVKARLRHAVDLNTFIEVYQEMLSSLRTEGDFHQVALACFARLHAEHVIHVEMFFDPQMHTTRGIALRTVLDGLAAARADAARQFGLSVGYIMCFNRNRTAESALATLEAVRPWQDRILGVGLDNNEELGFPAKFQAVFARARALGLHVTSHCDVNQPTSVAHIRGCLDLLQVERIDHGLNVLDDPALVAEAKARGTGFTACPTLLYTEIPGRLEARSASIRRMLDAGLLVTVNSDDPGIMRGFYVSDLYVKVQEAGKLSREQLITLARNSFLLSWIPPAERQADLDVLDAYVARHPADS
jgi:adenosine deaminase